MHTQEIQTAPTFDPATQAFEAEKALSALSQFKVLFNVLARRIHKDNVNLGWWNDLETGELMVNNIYFQSTKLGLIGTEVSEAIEGHRTGAMDDKLPHRKMLETELADVFIRLADFAEALELDVAGAIEEKLQYNLGRTDHKVVTRRQAGGKKY